MPNFSLFVFLITGYPTGYPTAAPAYNPNMYPTSSPGYAPGKNLCVEMRFGHVGACRRIYLFLFDVENPHQVSMCLAASVFHGRDLC